MINTSVELNNARKCEVEINNRKAFDRVVEICTIEFVKAKKGCEL